MYIIYAESFDLDQIKDLSEGTGEDVRYFERHQKDKNDLISFIENNRKIDGIAYLGIDEETLTSLSKRIKEINPNTYQLAMLNDIDITEDSEDGSRLDEIFKDEELIFKSIFKRFQEKDMRKKSRELKRTISSCKDGISIYIHDDPDMDAIASAMAFEHICDEKNVGSKTYYAGSIGSTESEIFLDNSDFDFREIDSNSVGRSFEENEKIAFLDFAEASHSDTIPDEIDPDVVIDHHSTNKGVKAREFTEIRSDVGATATLMTRHLLDLEMDISPMMASALLVGLKIDTSDYTKNISSSDYKAISYLTSISDKDILDVLENPPIYSETFTAMGSAIFNRRIKKDVLTTFCREVHHTDGIAKIADLLLRERDILTVLVYGVKGDMIHMSARSKDLQTNMGKIMNRAFSDIGEAGGHPHAAGGKIPLDRFEDEVEAAEMIEERFHDEVFEK